MKPVTKRWCSECEGIGQVIEVQRMDDPSSDDHPFDSRLSEGELARAVGRPHDCPNCAGTGFFYYDGSDEHHGEKIFSRDLPSDADVIEISGPEEWVEAQRSKAN